MYYPNCPTHQPVAVREYKRFRFGKWEDVCAHCRSKPNKQLSLPLAM